MSENVYERERNKTITFRLSEKEKIFLDARVQASNLKKTDYCVRACLYNQIVVVGKREHIAVGNQNLSQPFSTSSG